MHFRGILLAHHLVHHPHEADGAEKAQHQNLRFGLVWVGESGYQA
jgi:hypothetical protein